MTTPTAPREGISAKAIMTRLDALAGASLTLAPRNLVIYKPHRSDVQKGVALKLGFRYYQPSLPDGSIANYWTGGCWLELVPQKASDDANPRFDWRGDRNITVKLGLPDLSAFLLAYRTYRQYDRPVPVPLRPIVKADGKWVPSDADNQLGLVHKFDNETSFIRWTFSDATRSMLDVAKHKELRRAISLSLAEEVQLIRYLELAMDALLLTNA